MNIVFLIALTVLTVAVLWFLMPWISKTIEEPFVGSQDSCKSQNTTYAVSLGAVPTGRADYVEAGRQRYNFLNFLQLDRDRGVFDGTSAVGSTSTEIIEGAPPATNTPLKVLNKNIENALETVDVLPQRYIPGTPTPIINITSSPAPPPATGNRFTANISNAAAYFANALKRGISQESVSYVEERLPPKNMRLEDAMKCEANTMTTRYNSGSAAPESRGLPIKRAELCGLLDTTKADRSIHNAFSAPSESNKLCGVCIKDSVPVNTTIANKGIGGMYISRGDKNLDEAAEQSLRPSYGSCAEGYFFVAGEQEKCMKAAQRLNCDELASAGGFSMPTAKSSDGTDLAGSNCRACVTGDTAKYVYFTGESQRIRVRVVVPTGTGRTILIVKKQVTGLASLSDIGTYTITSTRSSDSQQNNDASSLFAHQGNTIYFNVDVNPGDKLIFDAAQEYPHRPRGQKEVFFVGFPTATSTLAAAQVLASSLDCELAKAEDLIKAQQSGMSVCNVGIAADDKKYTVRSNTISEENPILAVSGCTTNPTSGGIAEVDQPATGAWVYGIKPSARHLAAVEGTSGTILAKPNVANFYTYYQLKTETGIASALRTDKYSSPTTSADTFPNYRGICIQLEYNNTNTVNKYEPINIGVENHIITVGDLANMNISGSQLADRLKYYSRNGRFNDSERITFPKPTSGDGMIPVNQNQYWLWTPHQGTTQSASFKFTVEVPAFFYPATHPEDRTRCTGALYTNATYLNRAMRTVCDNGIDENDSTGCIAHCFKMVGGTVDGTLYPSTAENKRILLYKDYDAKNTTKRLKEPRTQQEIVEFLKERYVDVAKGTSARLQGLSESEKIAEMNTASDALFGSKAINPCQRVVTDSVSGTLQIQDIETIADMDEKCLDFLYRNTTGELAPPTYPTMGDAYSGLKYPDEYTTALDAEKEAFPYRACQPTGSWAPLNNPLAVQEIKAEMELAKHNSITGAVAKAKAVLNEMYTTANSTGPVSEAQERALKRCYGITKKSYVTNCDGVTTTIISIYKLLPTPTQVIDISSWTITLNNANVNTKLIMPNPGNVGYTKESFPITKYTRDGFISTTAENFTGVKLDDTQTLENIRIDSITTGGKYFGIYTIKPVLEGTSLVNADNRYTEESSSDTERVFIVCHKTSAGDYRMMRLVFSKASSMMLQVKITLVKYVLSSTNPTSLLVTNLWRSGTLFGVEDAPQGVATSDANETKGKGYGIKSLTITFEDPTPKYYYSLTATNSQKAVETVKLEKTGESGTFLVVLRDGQLTEGVAAQKLLTLSSTKNEVKFLQEDIRPYIVYEPSKITVGTTYRFESALGKRFFLKSSGVIAEVPQDTDDISTKFMLGERKALSTSPTPINTITPMNDPTRFMTMQTSAKVSKDITFAAFGAYANVDWSIVPAINGAYAFVSIALANIPGYFLVAEPLTVGTTTTYRAVAKLVDEKDDIAAFYACWRLYPAL